MSRFLQIAAGAATLPLIALATPASATLQIYTDNAGVVNDIVDNGPLDTNPAIGIIQLASVTINGILINGEIATSNSPTNPGFLNNSVLSVINTTSVEKAINIVVSDTDFAGPAAIFAAAGSGTWQGSIGSTIVMNWFADAANGQGADGTGSTPGTLLSTFSNTSTSIVQSFSNGVATGSFLASGPYSMSVQSEYTLQPFGQLINRGIDLEVSGIPEPSTWAMMMIGFVGLGYAAFRRGAKARTAAAI
jgi:hypothetical protein